MSGATEHVPLLVDLGYYADRMIDGWRRDLILLFYPDGRVGFQHRCNRGERGVITCAPILSPGHVVTPTITQPYPDQPHGRYVPLAVTAHPSILCPDCGTHGFVTAGKWLDA